MFYTKEAKLNIFSEHSKPYPRLIRYDLFIYSNFKNGYYFHHQFDVSKRSFNLPARIRNTHTFF